MNIRRLLRANTFLFAGLLALILFVANVVKLPAFVSVENWDANLLAFAPFAILAVASTPAVLTGQGGIDLSIAPLANLVNVVLVIHLLDSPTLSSPWIAIPIVLALSTGVGLVNGVLVGVLRYQPVIATVGGLLVLLGLNLKLAPVPAAATAGWVQALHGNLGPVPWGLILIALPLLAWGALRFTPFHRTLYFVGGNATTAYSAGVERDGCPRRRLRDRRVVRGRRRPRADGSPVGRRGEPRPAVRADRAGGGGARRDADRHRRPRRRHRVAARRRRHLPAPEPPDRLARVEHLAPGRLRRDAGDRRDRRRSHDGAAAPASRRRRAGERERGPRERAGAHARAAA